MAAAVDTYTSYEQELKDLLDGLTKEAEYVQVQYGYDFKNPELYKRLITIAILWTSIAGIYEGLTGDTEERKNYSINTWTDGTVPGLENAVKIYEKGIETGNELPEFIKEQQTIACGAPVPPTGASMGGSKQNIMKGGASKPARIAMTLAIITGLTFGATQSPLATATVTASSRAKDYLLQLAYGMRVVKTGCMTPAATFWNSLMVSVSPRGALDSCVQIAEQNKIALMQLRTRVIASFNGLITALSSAGIVLGRSEFTRMFTFIENSIADPLCDLITNIVTNAAAASGRTCRQMTRGVQQGIQSLTEYARQPRPIEGPGELPDVANVELPNIADDFQAATREVIDAAPPTQRIDAAASEPTTATPVSASSAAADSETMDSGFLEEIKADERALEIIKRLQRRVKRVREEGEVPAEEGPGKGTKRRRVNSGGRRRRRTKKNKKTRHKRPYRKTRQKKRKVSRKKSHTK